MCPCLPETTVPRGRAIQAFVHTHLATRTLRESQLQPIRELGEAEGLEQIRSRREDLKFFTAALVDAGADDRETRVVVLQPQGGSERLRVGRLDEDNVRSGGGEAGEERGHMTKPADDCRIEPTNVFVGFDDQEKSHEHVLVDRRMFSMAALV